MTHCGSHISHEPHQFMANDYNYYPCDGVLIIFQTGFSTGENEPGGLVSNNVDRPR